MTADSIALEGLCFQNTTEADCWRITAQTAADDKMPRTKLARIVTMLLTNGGITVTADEDRSEKKALFIEPIIDDRMFVACFVGDKQFADSLKEWTGSEYRWLSDATEKAPDAVDSLARKLYELVFVDGSGITCLSRTMLHTLLERHIYARWAECGTFHGITEYSMVCVSSACADKEDYIARNPFLTQYIELVMLALAQRASLIAFDRQISHVFVKIKNVRKLMKPCVFSKRINYH